MQVKILCENRIGNRSDGRLTAQWGLSLYIKYKGNRILFDAGHTDVFIENAAASGVKLGNTDFVVLSHRHWDHVGGLRYLELPERKLLICHSDAIRKSELLDERKISEAYMLNFAEKPKRFADDVYFLGEIPRRNDFEKGVYKDDPMLDDTALAVDSPKGAVVITGCSHSGICNICDYAKHVTGRKLLGVIGGMHLFENNPDTIDETINYFKRERPEFIYPMHCIDFPTMVRFRNEFGVEKKGVGDVIHIDTQ